MVRVSHRPDCNNSCRWILIRGKPLQLHLFNYSWLLHCDVVFHFFLCVHEFISDVSFQTDRFRFNFLLWRFKSLPLPHLVSCSLYYTFLSLFIRLCLFSTAAHEITTRPITFIQLALHRQRKCRNAGSMPSVCAHRWRKQSDITDHFHL